MTAARRRISSGGPWEASVGYSRAIVVGDGCWVSGTSDAGPDGTSRNRGDPEAQARTIFGIIERALGEAGFSLDEVVRTRMYVTDPSHAAPVMAVHGALFGSIRPAATLVVVAALLDPSLLVEIEAEARHG